MGNVRRSRLQTDYDSEGVTRAIGYTVDNARRQEYNLARRLPLESLSRSLLWPVVSAALRRDPV